MGGACKGGQVGNLGTWASVLQVSRLQSAKNAKIMIVIHVWPFDSHASEYISGTNHSFPPALSAGLQQDNYTFHLTVTQGQIWGLFFCVEKVKYKTPPIAPHAPAWGGSRLSNALGGCSGLFFKHWMGRITTQGRDNGGSEGLLTPSFLWKEASTWQLPIRSHLLKPTEKSLSYNQHFPEIAQEPKARQRKRF